MTVPTFREAKSEDVAAIIDLLREDPLGAERETAPLAGYKTAFAKVLKQPQTVVIVGVLESKVVASYQLTRIDGLSHRAARRGNIEDVRVAKKMRGQGIGRAMMDDAAARARVLNCDILQLVAHETRQAAHRFYLSVGFTASHVGFKRSLSASENAK